MFKLQTIDSLICPRIVCDACNKAIDVSAPDYKGALQIWDGDRENEAEGGYLADHIYHAHVGECWTKVAESIENRGGHVHDMHIEGELRSLMHNTGFEQNQLMQMNRAQRARFSFLKARNSGKSA
jgi:hypothetical protein